MSDNPKLENISETIEKLQSRLTERKNELEKREQEIQEKLNQANVGIKLKAVF